MIHPVRAGVANVDLSAAAVLLDRDVAGAGALILHDYAAVSR